MRHVYEFVADSEDRRKNNGKERLYVLCMQPLVWKLKTW